MIEKKWAREKLSKLWEELIHHFTSNFDHIKFVIIFDELLTEIEGLFATRSYSALGAIDGCVKQLGHHGARLPVHPQRVSGVLEKTRRYAAKKRTLCSDRQTHRL